MANRPPIQAVLFDLDGTLVDTAPDLVAALNMALLDANMAPVAYEQVKDAASHGSLALVHAANVSTDPHIHSQLQQSLLTHYHQINGRHSRYFAGIEALVSALHLRGIKQGIVTNKHARFSRPLCRQLPCFTVMETIISGDSCTRAKPDIAPMLLAASQLACPPEAILYLGDAKRDMQAARSAGMVAALAMWGYLGADDIQFWPSDIHVHQPLDLISAIDSATVNAAVYLP
ncbi:HAD family hydrolase [Shewanella sp. NIFS-20-20]|uniref:HAD family hydrolase n=1 Tax=Shewanella sp. NIFS-20-20 TaxID=2853806 RepID=UPI001C4676F6|nr:HAD-IA family hydrolase [Shewanella sp. NIFS-20-20]MBV7315232.1 HAD-IA family hydrolase [Shewanella sp. NIFS-20-20]